MKHKLSTADRNYVIELNAEKAGRAHELMGEIISGKARGRQSPDQITICDLSGTGVQDTAIADVAMARAAESAGMCTQIPI